MISLLHSEKKPLYVVFPPAITTFAYEAAEMLSEFIRDISGIKPVRTCAKSIPDDAVGFILGDTSLPESAEAAAELHYGECLVTCSGKRIICATHTEELLIEAVQYICGSATFGGGRLSVSENVVGRVFVMPRFLGNVPAMHAGTQVHCRRSHDSTDQVVVAGTTAEDYEKYLECVCAEGFEKLSSRECCGNLFASFRKGLCGLYVYFTPFNGTTRIICGPASAMHRGMPAKSDYTPVKPLMTVIGARFSTESRYLNCDSGAGNMGYVFRMEDGRFIIVDGGMELGDYAEKIVAAMKEQSEDPDNITVACWFLSHTHIDHTGAFLKVAAKFAHEVKIEEVACNFPSIPDAECYREAWNTRRVKEAVYSVFPDAKYSKLHTGEILDFGCAKAEILYTQDDLVRQYLSVANETLNTASMCVRLYIGGNTVILPADCDETANGILVSMYGDYLKSDILQVCHHGGWGGTTALYGAIDPELAIFSTTDALLPKYLTLKYNHDLVYGMNVIEVHNNADRCRTFELPYHPSERRIPDDPSDGLLYTKAKHLEAQAALEKLKSGQ